MTRIRVLLVACLATTAIWVGAPADAAGASCSGYVGGSKTIDFNAFAGHKVRATYKWCKPRPIGFIGPLQDNYLRGVTTPTISFPTRIPTGLGETLKLTQVPYAYSWTRSSAIFRFSVRQGHVAVPFSSEYDFELRVYPGGWGKICFVGKSCSSLQ